MEHDMKEVMTRERLDTAINELVESAIVAQVPSIDIMVVLESNKFAVQMLTHEATRKKGVLNND
jgi:hypothetical protein